VPDFRFKPTSASERLQSAISPIIILLAWLAGVVVLARWSRRSLGRSAR
jgi:hypothetical protein